MRKFDSGALSDYAVNLNDSRSAPLKAVIKVDDEE